MAGRELMAQKKYVICYAMTILKSKNLRLQLIIFSQNLRLNFLMESMVGILEMALEVVCFQSLLVMPLLQKG